ncbi:MAG: OsmC family protein [Nitrospiraceae bacterium]|nr:OsmC family protein [Nitrospiraceae bacterium]
MSEEKRKDAELDGESLEGYKKKIAPVTKGRLDWEKDLIFHARTQRGYEIDFDARIEWGCMPTESLLLSLAGCMAIDTVSFIQKMKGEISDFRIDITGERNPTPPQYYKRIDMVLHITGTNISEKQAKRAVALSHEKYCSVYHSLRKDLEVTVDYVLNNTGEGS